MILTLLTELDKTVIEQSHLDSLEEVKPTDKVVGTIDPRLAKLVSVIERIAELNKTESESLTSQMLEPNTSLGAIRKGIRDITRRQVQINLLAQIFRQELNEEYGTQDEELPKLQLRKGGVVVIEEAPPAERPRIRVFEVAVGGDHDCGNPDCEACRRLYRQTSEEQPHPSEPLN